MGCAVRSVVWCGVCCVGCDHVRPQAGIKEHEEEERATVAKLTKSAVGSKWMNAKNKSLVMKSNVDHERELQQSADALRAANQEHAQELDALRRDILTHADVMAQGREESSLLKTKLRKLENLKIELEKKLSQALNAASADRDAHDKLLSQVQEDLARAELQLGIVSKKDKQSQLCNQKLQHDALLTDTVLTEWLDPEVLGPIKTEVLTRMSKDYNDATHHFRDSAGNDVMKGGSNAQFDRVHKMYTEVLEEKATAVNQARTQQQQLQGKDHELSQAKSREAALDKQLKQAAHELELLEQQATANGELKQELAHSRATAEKNLKVERQEVKLKVMELEGALLRVKEESKAKYHTAKNETQIKEMKISALQSELDVLHKACQETQDTTFSVAIKNVIAKQRQDKSASIEQIVKMHNVRTPNTPHRGSDTSVEDMYHDLTHENNTLKLQTGKLQAEIDILKSHFPTYSASTTGGVAARRQDLLNRSVGAAPKGLFDKAV